LVPIGQIEGHWKFSDAYISITLLINTSDRPKTERVGLRKLLRYQCGCVSIYVVRDEEYVQKEKGFDRRAPSSHSGVLNSPRTSHGDKVDKVIRFRSPCPAETGETSRRRQTSPLPPTTSTTRKTLKRQLVMFGGIHHVSHPFPIQPILTTTAINGFATRRTTR
jgi:hypothetical protein